MFVDAYFDAIASPIIEDPLFISMKQYIAHHGVTVYDHCISVAETAYLYARKKGYKLDYSALIRGALLHDFYLYDWHHSGEKHKLHGFRHPFFALRNASKRFSLSAKEKNIIVSHMFPVVFWVFPHSKEARLVIKADRRCAWKETFSRQRPLQKEPS